MQVPAFRASFMGQVAGSSKTFNGVTMSAAAPASSLRAAARRSKVVTQAKVRHSLILRGNAYRRIAMNTMHIE